MFRAIVSDEPLFDETTIPSPREGVDIESLPETPSRDQFFLYSRVDGNTSVEQLCTVSGLGRAKTYEALRGLVEMGLVNVPGYSPDLSSDSSSEDRALDDLSESDDAASADSSSVHTSPEGSEATISASVTTSSIYESSVSETKYVESSSGNDFSSATSSPGQPGPASETSHASPSKSDAREETSEQTGKESPVDLSRLPTPPASFSFDEELLELDIPLSVQKRRELLCLTDQLDDINYYQFFGLERDASAGEIKRAYFKLSKRFHPDKYFRKDLGPFNDMLEEVFQHVTRGYRVLSKPDKRRTYDSSLVDRDETAATPMNQPSSVGLATKPASERTTRGGTSKRDAAFAVLIRQAEKLRREGEFVDAAEKYRKALRLKRDTRPAIQAAKMLLKADTQLDQAVLFAKAVLRIDAEHVDAHLLIGEIYERLGQIDRARRSYERVLGIESEHSEAQSRLERVKSR